MKIRIVLIISLLTGGLAPSALAQAPSALAQTAAQKEELLDKAQAALIWFRPMNEYAQRRVAPEKYREQLTPMELLQAAALLHEYRSDERADVAERLLLMLDAYQLTPDEYFEINDILGDTILRELAEIATPLLVNIPVEAEKFRANLNSSEKVVLYREPETALEVMKAVDVLSITGRPVLVRHYLRKYLAGTPAATPEESAKIVETIGTQKLMQLAIHPDFVPLGKEVVAKIIDEAKKHWQDDAKIAEALKETNWFTEPETSVRKEALPALQVLWKGDQLSVQQIFDKLATLEDEKEADELTAILLSLRSDMKEALAVALGNENPKIRYYAARGLATSVTAQESFLLYPFLFLGSEKYVTKDGAEIDLFRSRLSETEKESIRNILQQRKIAIPNQEQAAKVLFDRATDYFEKRRPLRTDAEGKVSFWDMNTNLDNVEYRSEDVEITYRHFTAQYYMLSFGIVPQDSANRKFYQFAALISRLEYFSFDDVTIGIFLDDFDIDNPQERKQYMLGIEQMLQLSLEKNCFDAAACMARALKSLENTDILKSTNGKPRALVQATASKNRGVRLAALEAIMNLTVPGTAQGTAPSPALLSPFAGSSLVAEALVWFSKSDGESVALSGHPQMAVANQTASLLLGGGYKTDVAVSCRELFQKAAASPDVEFIFVDARTTSPPVAEFVQAMRQDARTAEIPIAILSGNEPGGLRLPLLRRNEMTQFDRQSPDAPFRTSLSLTYPRVADEKSALWVLNDLLDKTGREPATMSPENRLEQAKQALGWLREIKLAELESGQKIYHFDDFDAVVLNALHSERRVEAGLALAAVVKSAALQSAIYDLAANAVYPMALRNQAGDAFEQSVERFGILLRGAQIQRLYDRYNQSEHEEKESQELLGRLLDVIERKAKK